MSGIQTVELLLVDKVQLAKSVVAQVRLLDQQGQGIPDEQLKFLQVTLLASSPLIVKMDPKSDAAPEDLLFVVEGSDLGLTMVTAEVTYGQKMIRFKEFFLGILDFQQNTGPRQGNAMCQGKIV